MTVEKIFCGKTIRAFERNSDKANEKSEKARVGKYVEDFFAENNDSESLLEVRNRFQNEQVFVAIVTKVRCHSRPSVVK